MSAHGRRKAKSHGQTMPGTDGKFPIRNLGDLSNAKHDIGRTSEPRAKVVRWINRRAKELGGKPVGDGQSLAEKAAMTSSGTYNFNLSDGGIVFEAFDRIRVRPAAITRHHLMSARNSMNLELISWDIKNGPNLWKIISGTINLVPGQIVYTLPANLVTLTELWYTTVNANGQAINSDRIMVPITRTQYAMIPNKAQQGIPTQFWFERLQVPQISIWEPAYSGAPQYVLNWFGLQRIQDANLGSGETPDIVYRGLEALCAGMTLRLADKFLDMSLWDKLFPRIEKNALTAWNDFVSEDQETGPLLMQPNVGQYGRMTR